jgi:Na+/H+-dicarboxylate symporter
MLRVLVTIVLPLLAPTALYLTGLAALRRLGRVRWRALPWVWLMGAGAVALAIVLLGSNVHFGAPQRGVYVPPQWLGGHIVPAHIEPQTGR